MHHTLATACTAATCVAAGLQHLTGSNVCSDLGPEAAAALALFDAGTPVAVADDRLRLALEAHRWGGHTTDAHTCPACVRRRARRTLEALHTR